MAANNVTLGGPPLGNVPTPDFYLRLKQNIESLQTSVNGLQRDVVPKDLNAEQLQQVQNALQAFGSNPLNLTGLPGVLLQPQKSKVEEVTKLPATGDFDGQLVLFLHVLYRWSQTRKIWEEISIIILQDTFVNWGNYPANNYANGTIYLQTDRRVAYINRDLGNNQHYWFYLFGQYADVISSLPPFTTADIFNIGYVFYAIEYKHAYYWDGNNWNFAPGDPGSGYIVAGTNRASDFNVNVWARCDGNTTQVAQNNGSVVTITTPNLTSHVFLTGGNYNGNVIAANSPTWSNNHFTDPSNQTLTIQNGNGNNVVVNIDSHTHTLSNNNAVLNPPSEANGGLPMRIELQWYMRR